jgi:hypothetical protein
MLALIAQVETQTQTSATRAGILTVERGLQESSTPPARNNFYFRGCFADQGCQRHELISGYLQVFTDQRGNAATDLPGFRG